MGDKEGGPAEMVTAPVILPPSAAKNKVDDDAPAVSQLIGSIDTP